VRKDPNYIFVSGVSYFKNIRDLWGKYLFNGCTSPPPLEVLELWNRDGVVDIVTRLSLTTANRGSSPDMDKELSSLRPHGFCGHTASCAVGIGVFRAGQVAGA